MRHKVLLIDITFDPSQFSLDSPFKPSSHMLPKPLLVNPTLLIYQKHWSPKPSFHELLKHLLVNPTYRVLPETFAL
jgi:hypothetical protein